MKERICRGLRAAADLILPRKCIVCGKILLSEEKHLCLECLADMPMTFFWTMSHNPMADRFNEIIQNIMEEMTDNERYAYAAALFFYHDEADYRLIPYQIKYHGMASAEVVRGGVDTKHVSSKTMESKLCPGLYFAGEILDVDGECGGYNLQWAYSSAKMVATAINEKKSKRQGQV